MLKKALSMLFTSLLFGLCVADDSKEVYPFEDVVQEERFFLLSFQFDLPGLMLLDLFHLRMVEGEVVDLQV